MNAKPAALAAFSLLMGLAVAQPSAMDRKFVRMASMGNHTESQLGKLALRKGHTADIRDFGARMISDHGNAQQQLVRAAQGKGYPLPMRMMPEGMRMQTRLQRMGGAQFDHAYRQAMIEDHQKDIADYERESRRGKDPAIRAYATKTLPILREHLRMIQRAKV